MSGTAWALGKSEFLEEKENKAVILIQLELGGWGKCLIPGLGQEKCKRN